MTEAIYKAVGIGAGYFSRHQYEAWSRIPEVRLAAIYNRTEAKARALMAQFGVPRYYADWREMIDRERPDFVDIITPPETHKEMCLYAFSRSVNVVCQKPLAPTYEEAAEIVEAAKKAGVRFMVHENWRWQPWYRKIKAIQKEGRVGQFVHLLFVMRMGDGWGENAYLARQPFFRDYPRLLVYETGVHFIDTFRFLMGEISEVFARLRRMNPVIKGEDVGQIFFQFTSGATAVWDANRYNEVETADPRYTFGQLRIDATGGHLTLDTEGKLRMKRLGEPSEHVEYGPPRRGFAGDCVYALQRHFIECLRSGREFESNGDDYLKTLRVVDAVYESARTGQVAAVPRDG